MFATFVVLVTVSFGATRTWIGGTSTDWNTASNWSSNTIPGQGDDVIIGPIGVGKHQPSVGNLEMGQWNKPSSLIIDGNAILTITGNITVVSSASIELTGGGTINHTGSSGTTFPGYGSATLTITNGSFITNGNFQCNTALSMSAGSITVNGDFTPNNTFTANGAVTVTGAFEIKGNTSITTGPVTVGGNCTVYSGKSYSNSSNKMYINGNLALNNSNSEFHAGNDSVIIQGSLNTNGNDFYGDTATIIIHGSGTNSINGNFYTNSASILFDSVSFTNIGSGGRFYANTGTVVFIDSVKIGNNGKYYGGDGTTTFNKSLLVSSSGEITLETGTMNFIGNATFSNSGTLNAGSGSLNFGGDVSVDNSGGTINADSSTINISGNISNSGSFNAGTSTVNLTGTSNQSISDDITFYNLTVQTQGTLTANGNVTVQNNGTIGGNSNVDLPDNNDQFEVIGDLTDSTGGSGVSTNKPYVTSITVNSSTEIIVNFNEAVTAASAQNASNSTWAARTITSRTLIAPTQLRIQFTPALAQNVEYTLSFQNIQNTQNPVGTMTSGLTKKFTWTAPSLPTTASSSLNYTNISSNSYTVNWTKGNGTKRIVIARAGSAVNFAPTNGTEYAANASFGSGTNLNSGNYVVYQGTGETFALTGLSAGVTYHFSIYEYNGSGATTVYQSITALVGSQIASYEVPTTQPSSFSVAGSSDSSITLSWIAGDGSSRIVIARASSTINSLPSDNSSYTGNSEFGLGSEIGSNNYVVYSGSGTSVTVTGLLSNKKYYFTILEYNGTGGLEQYLSTSNPIIATNTYIRINVKVFLEGPFNGTDMNASDTSLLPKTQVYSGAPFSYAGTESVSSIPNTNIVDWVLVELREASSINYASDTSVVGRRAGFLLKDGSIVDLDGISPLYIQTNRSGNMYAVVYHRTHIAVQSSDTLSRGTQVFNFDFTTSGSTAFGNNDPLNEVSTGIYAMYCGRVATNTGSSVGSSDATAAWNARNGTGYLPEDVNLDGVVDADDRSSIYNNQGAASEIVQ